MVHLARERARRETQEAEEHQRHLASGRQPLAADVAAVEYGVEGSLAGLEEVEDLVVETCWACSQNLVDDESRWETQEAAVVHDQTVAAAASVEVVADDAVLP